MGSMMHCSMDCLRSSASPAAGSCAGLQSTSYLPGPSHSRTPVAPRCIARSQASRQSSRGAEPLRAATVEAPTVDQSGGDGTRDMKRSESIREQAHRRSETCFRVPILSRVRSGCSLAHCRPWAAPLLSAVYCEGVGLDPSAQRRPASLALGCRNRRSLVPLCAAAAPSQHAAGAGAEWSVLLQAGKLPMHAAVPAVQRRWTRGTCSGRSTCRSRRYWAGTLGTVRRATRWTRSSTGPRAAACSTSCTTWTPSGARPLPPGTLSAQNGRPQARAHHPRHAQRGRCRRMWPACACPSAAHSVKLDEGITGARAAACARHGRPQARAPSFLACSAGVVPLPHAACRSIAPVQRCPHLLRTQ